MTDALPTKVADAPPPSAAPHKDLSQPKSGLVEMMESPRAGWTLPALAILVAAASLLVSSRSYFFADDFFYGDILGSTPLTVELLSRSWFGHFVPGFILLDWTFYRVFGLNWALASVLIAVVVAWGTVAFVRCLDAVIGRKNIATIGGAMFGLSLAVLYQSVWWGAVVTNVIPLAAGISAIGCLTRWTSTGRMQHLLAMGLMYGLAVAFYEKSLLFAAYAGLWTVLVVDAGQPFGERFRLMLRRWPAWLVIGLISSAVLFVYTRGGFAQDLGAPGTVSETAQFVVRGAALGLVPSIFGADLQQFPYILGPQFAGIPVQMVELAFAVLANIVLFIVFIKTVRVDHRSWGPWILAALAILINQVPLAQARFQFFGIGGGRLLRYQLDNVFILLAVLTIVVSWYLSHSKTAPTPRISRPRRAARLVGGSIALIVCLTLWVLSGAKSVERANGVASRMWSENLSASLPPEGQHLLEAPLPEHIAFAVMYPYNLVSRVVPQIHPEVAVGVELSGGWVIGPDGTAGPAQFVASKSVEATECSGPDGTIASVALDGGSAEPSYLLIELEAEMGGTLSVSSGPPGSPRALTRTDSPLPLVEGDNSVIVAAPAGADLAMITAGSGDTAFCVSRISVGQLST